MSKVYLITGTSSGFGRALAEAVLQRGDRAVLTARKPETVNDLVEQNPQNAIAVRLDVTNAAQRQSAVQAALDKFGRVDVLVNNAGYGTLGRFEEFSSEQLRQQMEVNFFAAAEMTRVLLPVMRRQKSGHILNVSSVGGIVSLGGFAVYCASKFAPRRLFRRVARRSEAAGHSCHDLSSRALFAPASPVTPTFAPKAPSPITGPWLNPSSNTCMATTASNRATRTKRLWS
jgi:NAD(P)-dependent dehydrogenase (short-subunit alcohol dehydrogenase family)